jgi:hypothetical protein
MAIRHVAAGLATDEIRIGGLTMNTTPIDPTTLRIFPAKDGFLTTITAGEYAVEGEPDLVIEVSAPDDMALAQVIVDALKRHYGDKEG